MLYWFPGPSLLEALRDASVVSMWSASSRVGCCCSFGLRKGLPVGGDWIGGWQVRDSAD